MIDEPTTFDLAAICDRQAILDLLGTKPLNVDRALALGVKYAQDQAVNYFRTFMTHKLTDLYAMHEIVNGPYNKDWRLYQSSDWVEALNDSVEKLLESYQHVVTLDWIGDLLMKGAPLYEEHGIAMVANDFAVNAWKNMTYLHKGEEGQPKTYAQILASIGILRSDLDGLIGNRSVTTVEEIMPMEPLEKVIERLNTWTAMVGMDKPTIKSLLDNAVDTDDGLAQSGLSQLGGKLEDRGVLQMGLMIHGGTDVLAELIHQGKPLSAISAAASEPAQQTGVSAGAPEVPPEPKPGRKKRQAPDGVPQAGCIPATALAAIKDYTGIKTEMLGEGLGVSRSTFENYVRGKAALRADNENYNFLLGIVDEHIQKLSQARQEIVAAMAP